VITVLEEAFAAIARALLGSTGPTGVERFVTPSGSDANDGQSPDTAFATIGRALQDQACLVSSDVLTVHVAPGSYREALEVPPQVTLRGPEAGPLPEIQAAGTGPAVRLRGPNPARVRLERLRITGGGRAPGSSLGGGIALREAHDVTIARCEVSGNEGYRGGGISVVGCTQVFVEGCDIHGNRAGTQETALRDAGVEPTTDGLTLEWPEGDGHGGGVYVERSEGVSVKGCRLVSNQAILLGGGIAVVGIEKGPVQIEGNDIACNQVCHGEVGGFGFTSNCSEPDMPDAVLAQIVSSAAVPAESAPSVVGLLHGVGHASGMGGGIGLERVGSAVTIRGNRIGLTATQTNLPNRARRGGGISCFTGAYPLIVDNEIAWNLASDDGGGIAIDQFDPFLPAGLQEYHGVRASPLVPRRWITLERTSLHHNRARSDGGGLYATGGVLLSIKGSTDPAAPTLVSDNHAHENGGGIRVSYATNLHISDVQIRRNTANLAGAKNGGGGVAARNSIVTLERCDVGDNQVGNFGGAGVYVVSCYEGGFDLQVATAATGSVFVANAHEKFDDIMEGVHGFRTRVLRLTDCTGSSNDASQATGAGGFLYAVRNPDLGGDQPLWVAITGSATAIGTNVSEYDKADAGTRKRGNVVIELSGRATNGVPDDRVYAAPELAANAIAPSATEAAGPLPPQPGPALKVLVDAKAEHDVVPTLPDYVHGPRPAIASVSPSIAAQAGGTLLTIAGSGFDGAPRVRLGGVEAKIRSATPTALVVESPPRPVGTDDVAVELGWGPRAVLPGAVQVLPPPTLEAVEPSSGVEGNTVTIRGTHLQGDLVVELIDVVGRSFAPVTAHPSDTEIQVTIPAPPLVPTTVEVQVTLSTGAVATLPAGFTYLPLP
jgi:hypothetical protein